MNNPALIASSPLLIVGATAVVAMIGIAIRRSHGGTAAICIFGLALALANLWLAQDSVPVQINALLVIDRYALVYMGIILAASLLVLLLSYPYLERRSEHKEEFYLLLVLATLGSMVLAASTHMVSFFLSLELLSISLYALIAYPRTETAPLEAAIKYLILAASSSAFLLFGLALIYIAQGNMEFSRISVVPDNSSASFAYLAGIVLMITGIGFKLAVVPFHLWTPDVYQGAPLPVTAFVATVSKGGVFAFLLRWLYAGSASTFALPLTLTIIAIASMLIGNLLALRQTNIKRLLAYSSIAHMGYFLVAVVAGRNLGPTAATYYLTAYIATILGAFGCLLVLSQTTRETETFDDVRGLFWRRPVVASIFTAMILSLAGIPLTAGFLGKFYVLAAGASATAWTLIIVLIVSSTMGLVYYLRIIVAMFADEKPAVSTEPPRIGISPAIALGVLTVALFVLGVYPAPLWNAIAAAATALGQPG